MESPIERLLDRKAVASELAALLASGMTPKRAILSAMMNAMWELVNYAGSSRVFESIGREAGLWNEWIVVYDADVEQEASVLLEMYDVYTDWLNEQDEDEDEDEDGDGDGSEP